MYTPGPWKVYHLPKGRVTGNGSLEIQGPDGLTLVAYIPTEGDNPKGFRNRKDNARLIAAAPEMLAACESSLRVFQGWLHDADPHNELAAGESAERDAAKVMIELVSDAIAATKEKAP